MQALFNNERELITLKVKEQSLAFLTVNKLMMNSGKIVNAPEAFDKSAKIYSEKFMDVSLYADQLDLFCNSIASAKANILDIACGPGNISKYLLDKKPDYKILGIDLSPNMLSLAQTNNPNAQFKLGDCRKISLMEQVFDGIVCGFCLPFLTPQDATNLIADVSGLLISGGIFYLSTMEEGENTKSRYQTSSSGDQVYVNYHREDYLVDALTKNSFEIVDTARFNNHDKDGTVITDLVLVGKSKK